MNIVNYNSLYSGSAVTFDDDYVYLGIGATGKPHPKLHKLLRSNLEWVSTYEYSSDFNCSISAIFVDGTYIYHTYEYSERGTIVKRLKSNLSLVLHSAMLPSYDYHSAAVEDDDYIYTCTFQSSTPNYFNKIRKSDLVIVNQCEFGETGIYASGVMCKDDTYVYITANHLDHSNHIYRIRMSDAVVIDNVDWGYAPPDSVTYGTHCAVDAVNLYQCGLNSSQHGIFKGLAADLAYQTQSEPLPPYTYYSKPMLDDDYIYVLRTAYGSSRILQIRKSDLTTRINTDFGNLTVSFLVNEDADYFLSQITGYGICRLNKTLNTRPRAYIIGV